MDRWPQLSLDGAAILEDGKVHIGPAEDDTRLTRCSHVAFREPSQAGNNCRCYAMSTDGRLLAVAFKRSHTIWVWRLSDGLLIQRLRDEGHTDIINSLAFSPTGHTIVSGSNDRSAIIWDVRTGHAARRLGDHAVKVWRVAFSPDGLLIATGCDNGAVKIWSSGSAEILRSLDLGSKVWGIHFSSDSVRLVVELKSTATIYSIQNGTLITALQHEGGEDMRVSLSCRGDRVLTSTNDGKAKIYNAITGEEIIELSQREDEINSVAFSPDGAEVAIASDDRAVVTCDSWTGQHRRIYKMSSKAWSVAYSPNGDYIAMGDSMGHVRVCDAKSGVFLTEFKAHAKDTDHLQFLPDCHSLLSCSQDDDSVLLWSIRDVIRLR